MLECVGDGLLSFIVQDSQPILLVKRLLDEHVTVSDIYTEMFK